MKVFYQDTYKVYLKKTERSFFEKTDNGAYVQLEDFDESALEEDEKIKPLQVSNMNVAVKIIRAHELDKYPNEHIMVIAIGACGHVLGTTVLGIGSDQCVDSNLKGLFQFLFLTNAHAFILAHNHPCGYVRASDGDISLTRRVKQYADVFGFDLLDHIIVNTLEEDKGAFFSMKAEKII